MVEFKELEPIPSEKEMRFGMEIYLYILVVMAAFFALLRLTAALDGGAV